MPLHSWRAFLGSVGLLAAVVGAGTFRAGGAPGLAPGPVPAEELDRLIRALGDPSFDRRTEATRGLCAVGMQAYEPLRQVAQGTDAEAALRAKALLRTLDQLLFSGVEIELAFDPPAVAWNQPATLRVTMRNVSAWPARIPFVDSAESEDPRARQFGLLLDVADWLRVQAADGRRVELHTDEFGSGSAMAAELERRLDQAPTSTLDPGASRTVDLVAFNRGWSRYRLLDAGEYTVQLDYDPPWSDSVLVERHVGRVVSNRASVTITDSAPEVISRAGIVAGLSLERAGEDLVVRLRNRTDVPLAVDLRFGPDAASPKGTWVYESGEEVRTVPAWSPAGASGALDSADALRDVLPGSELEMVRVSRTSVLETLRGAGIVPEGDRWTLAFRYWNPGSALRGGDSAGGEPSGPGPGKQAGAHQDGRRLLTTHHASNPLVAPLDD